MTEEIEKVRQSALSEIDAVRDIPGLDSFRIKYLSRKGAVARLFEKLRNAPASERPALGKKLNELRSSVQSIFQQKEASIGSQANRQGLTVDLTLRSEEHTSELQSPCNLVCRLLLEKKKTTKQHNPRS